MKRITIASILILAIAAWGQWNFAKEGVGAVGAGFASILLPTDDSSPSADGERGSALSDTVGGDLWVHDGSWRKTYKTNDASIGATANRLALRDGSGRIEAEDPISGDDVVNLTYFNANAASGGLQYYINNTGTNGADADVNCDAGYHLCRMGEWYGRTYDTSKSTGNWDGNIWYDADTNVANGTAGNLAADCENWVSSSGSHRGTIISLQTSGSTITGTPFVFNAASCNGTWRTICCEDN